MIAPVALATEAPAPALPAAGEPGSLLPTTQEHTTPLPG